MNSIERKNKNKLIFYICGISIPLLQFLFFYVFIVFDSILMAFQVLDEQGTVLGFTVNNFVEVFKVFLGKSTVEKDIYLLGVLKDSIILFFVSILFGSTSNILFSNYLYKKKAGHKFFQIVLFIPQILSAVVMSRVYMYFVTQGVGDIGALFGLKIFSLMKDSLSKFIWLIVFSLWSGFGAGVLMYTSTMSGIPVEVVESAQLDGITPFKELIFITMPMIYPTFVTFMVVNVASIFTNQMHLYTFYGQNIDSVGGHSTLGYYLFARAAMWDGSWDKYAYLSALGVVLSLVAIPLTLGTKKLLEKVGPSFE